MGLSHQQPSGWLNCFHGYKLQLNHSQDSSLNINYQPQTQWVNKVTGQLNLETRVLSYWDRASQSSSMIFEEKEELCD